MNKENLKVGMVVTYVPRHARGNENHKDRELGKVKSWNDRFVFVDYGDGRGKATSLEDLREGNLLCQ